MVQKRTFLRLTLLTGVIGLFAGCASTPQGVADHLAQPQGAALVIDLRTKAPIGIAGPDTVQVFFARIDNADGLLQQTIVRSNHVKDGRAYLLNARPGTYVAVASLAVNSAPRHTFTTYFPREVVERTRVTVGEGEFAAMGSCLLGTSVGLDGADEVQAHYKNVIAPGQATGTMAMAFSGSTHYRGQLIECKSDETGRKDVLQKARGDLAGSGWAARLN
jgi:hypothetical protein